MDDLIPEKMNAVVVHGKSKLKYLIHQFYRDFLKFEPFQGM